MEEARVIANAIRDTGWVILAGLLWLTLILSIVVLSIGNKK